MGRGTILNRAIGRATAGACVLALAAGGLASAAPAFADADNTGTTEVTVEVASDTQLAFKVPTIIPFSAMADGELVGPSADATRITNLSVFGIHVTGATVEASGAWTLVTDAAYSDTENSIDFQFGPDDALLDAADTFDDDVSTITAFNMTYCGSAGDYIAVASQGDVANVTIDLEPDEPDTVANITWTLAAGAASDTSAEASEDDEAETTDSEETTPDAD